MPAALPGSPKAYTLIVDIALTYPYTTSACQLFAVGSGPMLEAGPRCSTDAADALW